MWPFKKPEKKPELAYIIDQDGWGRYRARYFFDGEYSLGIGVWRDTFAEAENDIARHAEAKEKSVTRTVAEYYF